MAATTRILTLSLSSTTTTRLSFSLITFSNPYTPRRLLHGFRPISYSATATATATEPSLESSKHSILLERLRIRYLKDSGETNTYKKSKLGFKESEIGESELKKDVNKIEKVLLGFNELGLGDKVLGASSEMGITVPTVIQSLGIPAVLDEKSVVLGSHTGSGKTLAYLLPPLVQAPTTMALLSRARIVSSTLFGKLAHHPPIQRAFSSSSTAYNPMFSLDISSQIGSCMPISMMRIGTIIHNIEMNPGQGGKLVRAAGTSAKILKEPSASKLCLIRLPSGVEKLIDSQCRATIGVVSNPEHATKKLRKAGQTRWLGIRPTVRGVAMNPVDHPHGGGEGKSKSSGCRGRVSTSPWGKPSKSGYKTGPLKKRK